MSPSGQKLSQPSRICVGFIYTPGEYKLARSGSLNSRDKAASAAAQQVLRLLAVLISVACCHKAFPCLNKELTPDEETSKDGTYH